RRWFEHYQGASRTTRERLVSHPQLFVQALNDSAEQRASERLREGPEGECEADLRCLDGLCNDIKRYAEHDPDGDPQQRARSQGARSDPARDQPSAQAVA